MLFMLVRVLYVVGIGFFSLLKLRFLYSEFYNVILFFFIKNWFYVCKIKKKRKERVY